MLKQLISAVIFSVIATNSANAMEITKGKLIHHKEWNTGKLINVTAGKLTPKQQLIVDQFKKNSHHTNSGYDYINVYSNVYITENGENNALALSLTMQSLQNFTDAMHSYTIDTSLCLLNSSTMGDPVGCHMSTDDLTLDPEGGMTAYRSPLLTFSKLEPAVYMFMAITSITRDDNETVYSNSAYDVIDLTSDNPDPSSKTHNKKK